MKMMNSQCQDQNMVETSADDHDEEQCILCCKEIKICSIMDCEHIICYECSTRLRVLCDKLECPICRQKTTVALFSSRRGPFQRLYLGSLLTDDRYKLAFEDAEVRRAFDSLLAHQCPRCAHGRPFGTFQQLEEHVMREHNLFYCSICVAHLKLFSKERKLYTRELLEHHHQRGDAGDASYSGHPLCHLCEQRYIDHDELYRHKRRDHFYCHLCEADNHQLFYRSCSELQAHFRREHYLCEEGECRVKRLIVFRTNIDLQAHRASAHAASATVRREQEPPVLTLQFTAAPVSRRRRADSRDSVMEQLSPVGTASSPAGMSAESRLGFPSSAGTAPETVVGSATTTTTTAAADATATALSFNLNRRPAHTNVTINVNRRTTGGGGGAAAGATSSLGSPTSPQPRISQVSSSGNITMQSPTMEQPPLIRGGRLVSDLESLFRPRPEPPPSPPAAARSYSGTNSVRFSIGSGGGPAARELVAAQQGQAAAAEAAAATHRPRYSPPENLQTAAEAAAVTHRPRYSPPENLQARSCRLVKLARELCRSEETLRTFRQLSAEFRCGLVSGEHYYRRCLSLLGGERLARLFPELLVLLPDIDKQTELLAAHEVLNKDGLQRHKFLCCPTCGQVLTLADWGRHTAQHCRGAGPPRAAWQSVQAPH